MKRLIISIALLLSACSVSHDIKIPEEPCFYPYKNYDFTLCKKFIFLVNNHRYVIEKGFATDFASIPRILWSIYSPMKTETIPGAVIHDFLYYCPGKMSRAEADSIFYDALVLDGISKRTAFRYWAAVRVFGASHFNSGVACPLRTIREKYIKKDVA